VPACPDAQILPRQVAILEKVRDEQMLPLYRERLSVVEGAFPAVAWPASARSATNRKRLSILLVFWQSSRLSWRTSSKS
jgi:hypothetical protein